MWLTMAIISASAPKLLPLPTNPNTVMFAGQDEEQWGGRETRRGNGGRRKKEIRQRKGKLKGQILEN